MPNTENITKRLDHASQRLDEYMDAGSQGRQERALAAVLDEVIEAVRELAGPAKKATEPKAENPAPAKKAPAKKSAAKK